MKNITRDRAVVKLNYKKSCYFIIHHVDILVWLKCFFTLHAPYESWPLHTKIKALRKTFIERIIFVDFSIIPIGSQKFYHETGVYSVHTKIDTFGQTFVFSHTIKPNVCEVEEVSDRARDIACSLSARHFFSSISVTSVTSHVM